MQHGKRHRFFLFFFLRSTNKHKYFPISNRIIANKQKQVGFCVTPNTGKYLEKFTFNHWIRRFKWLDDARDVLYFMMFIAIHFYNAEFFFSFSTLSAYIDAITIEWRLYRRTNCDLRIGIVSLFGIVRFVKW